MSVINHLKYIILILICVFPQSLHCLETDHVHEIIPEQGHINWTLLTMQAEGSGQPPQAESDAKANAIGHISNIADTIRISYNLPPIRTSDDDSLIQNKIRELVLNPKLLHQDYLTDGAVNARYEMDIKGGILQLILPPEIEQVDSIKTISDDGVKEKVPAKNRISSSESDKETEKINPIYTSFVFDTRGLNIEPVIIPVIMNEKQEIVYGPAFISREFAVQKGVCRYVKDIKTAEELKLTGNNPLTISVLSLENGSLVISNNDSHNLMSESEHLVLLKECRVIVIID